MGIASVDNVEKNAGGNDKKESTPTFLSGESLTFPLITGVGTAAVSLYSALAGERPTAWVVVIVAAVCGILVTIWGVFDATAAEGRRRRLGAADYYKRTVIGLLNTVLLAAALWGTVAVTQAAYAPAT